MLVRGTENAELKDSVFEMNLVTAFLTFPSGVQSEWRIEQWVKALEK